MGICIRKDWEQNQRSYWYFFASTELAESDVVVTFVVLSRLHAFHFFWYDEWLNQTLITGWSPFTSLTSDPTSDRPEVDQIHPKTKRKEERCHSRYPTHRMCICQDVGSQKPLNFTFIHTDSTFQCFYALNIRRTPAITEISRSQVHTGTPNIFCHTTTAIACVFVQMWAV